MSLQHPILIENETVEVVDSFKYLRPPLANKLRLEEHTKDI